MKKFEPMNDANLEQWNTKSEKLIAAVDEIEQLYRSYFVEEQDIKALKGLENCVELKMKIWGVDGKQQIDVAPKNDPSIPLTDLPTDLLENIVNHLKQSKMQKQN